VRETIQSALVPFTVEQMFALVEDFESYPQFVPWVKSTRIVERGPDMVVGRLEMHLGVMRETFATRTVFDRPREITLELIEGPFKTFEGRWTFAPVGDLGSKVGLAVRFEFANALLDVLLSRTFEKRCSELVDAFVARARSLHRPR
jgi:ribosome-associated toxin RatA of RatAB toxin-antitoxin module